MSIELITFDLDDTLWEARPVLLKAEATMLQWLAAHRPLLTIKFAPEHLRQFKHQVATAHPELAHRVSTLRLETLRLALRQAGYGETDADTGAEEAFRVFHQARQQVTLFEAVVPTLAQLASQYRLGAITNGNADVHQLGLSRFFDFALSAEDFATGKPEPELFLHALELAGCSAERAVHVGDHPLDDMEGAHRCGFHTIWANFKVLPWQASWRPTAEIRHWNELILALPSPPKAESPSILNQ
jgi:FMN hydrolase / 5-amino-6-(5-phospho-D-ribitylamino)uracil phosphatase